VTARGIMNYRAMSCPACHRPLGVRVGCMSPVLSLLLVSAYNLRFYCPFCETRLGINPTYSRWTLLVIVLLTALVALVTHSADSGGTWLLAMLLTALALRTGFLTALPPPLVCPRKGRGISFGDCYIRTAWAMVSVGFALEGWAIVVLGTKQELHEHLLALSYPIALLSRNFLITSRRSLIDVLGVLLANSYFGAFAIWLCVNAVHAVLRRNRVAQLGITGSNVDPED